MPQVAEVTPTSVSPTEETTTTAPVILPLATPVDRSELGAPISPIEEFTSAALPGTFFLDLVSFNSEWFGTIFDVETSDFVLARSSDGLEWETVVVDAERRVVGLGLSADRLVAAVTTSAPIDSDLDLLDRTYEIDFFDSLDGDKWQPSQTFAPMTGDGEAFYAAIGSNAVVLPTIRMTEEPDIAGLLSFFDGVLQPERASRVCDAEHTNIGGTRVALLTDCDGNLLGELNQYDAPDLFRESGYIKECVSQFRSGLNETQNLIFQERPAENDGVTDANTISERRVNAVGLGRVFGSTYLSAVFGESRQFCTSGAVEPSSWSINRATADASTSVLADVDSIGGASVGVLGRTSDDVALLIESSPSGGVNLLSAREPYIAWESTLLVNDDDMRFALWSMTSDGSLTLGTTGGRWIFLRPDGTIIKELAVIDAQNADVLLATNDYAIVRINFDFEEARLVRVPLTE